MSDLLTEIEVDPKQLLMAVYTDAKDSNFIQMASNISIEETRILLLKMCMANAQHADMSPQEFLVWVTEMVNNEVNTPVARILNVPNELNGEPEEKPQLLI